MHGANIVLNGCSDRGRLDQRAAELRSAHGVECLGLFANLTEPGEVDECYRQIFARFKRLDVLVNNAGILQDALLGMIPTDMVDRTFRINTFAAIYNLQQASRLMTRNRSGAIVNITSIIGTNGNQGQAVYAASKAALIGLTLSSAKELASRNIRVNAVAPGFIDTDMTRNLPEGKFQERMNSIGMGRIGQPDDIANAILFLASDLSAYITGQVLGVDGGMLI